MVICATKETSQTRKTKQTIFVIASPPFRVADAAISAVNHSNHMIITVIDRSFGITVINPQQVELY